MAMSERDHPITIAPYSGAVRIVMKEDPSFEVAHTTAALALNEADYPRVFYIPRGDVVTEFLSRTDRTTHCPYKGEANYFSVFHNGILVENGIWSYETPLQSVAEIKDYLAFDGRHFEITAEH